MLSHLRVIDLTDGGSSIAGRILADLGAEVILLEPPEGVASRRVGPFVDDIENPERSLEFFAHHRGKRSLAVDLTKEAESGRLLELVRSADVWIEDRSFPGLDGRFAPDTLSARAPHLVHARITPFGEIGPKSNWAATDLTVTAASYALRITGDADQPPLSCSVPQAFFHAGAEASTAIMLALAEREKSGLGQYIDVSAQTAMMQSTQSAVLSHGWNYTPNTRTGGGVSVGPYRVRFIYECLDGFINFTFLFGEPIGYATTRFFEWMDEEGYSTEATRNEDWVAYGAKIMKAEVSVEAHEAVLEAIERFTRTKTKAEFLAAAFERRVLVVPLNNCSDLLASEQLASRDFWRPIKCPSVDREILFPGAFAKLSATPLQVDVPAPSLGEFIFDEALAERAARETPNPIPNPTRGLPLDGLKVLDFTWVYAGPVITRQLADYGATVIKVESNSAHDALRSNGPFKDDQPGPERSGNFSNLNLGKLSLGVNLKTPEGRALILDLVDWADVVIENFSPKAMIGWGLDWESLKQRKPSLVMLSSSLNGGTGPQKMLAGYGTMGSAIAGFGFVTGWPGRRPSAPYVAYTDYVSPRFGFSALLAAVDHARKTGVGQHIDVSQAEASIHFLGAALLDYTANGRIATAHGNQHPHYAPSGVYPSLGDDEWIAVAAPNDDTFASLDSLAGRSWGKDARYASTSSRIENAEALDTKIAEWTAGYSAEELETRLQTAGIPAHRVHTSETALADPQLIAREHFVELEYAAIGPVPYENSRARLITTPAVLSPCPTLGEHNQHVLSEVLGLDDEAITDLVISGAIE